MYVTILIFLLISFTCNAKHLHPELPTVLNDKLSDERDMSYWKEIGLKVVEDHVNLKRNMKIAKNVILFLGDGLSVNTITATRSYINKNMNEHLNFEKFPFTGMAKTYCVDKQTSDSACTATAYFCGVKSNYDMIGVRANVKLGDCDAAQMKENQTPSIGKWALDAMKGVGFVTTSSVTDASPVGLYGHTSNRNWENDSDVIRGNCSSDTTPDIAKQLIRGEVGSKMKVIMGGGRRQFRPNTTLDEEVIGAYGARLDGVDLIEEWKQSKKSSGQYVWNRKQLMEFNANNADYLLGLFDYNNMMYHLETLVEGVDRQEPSLADMTSKAIDVLSKEREGYFLFVEGGNIDSAHHDNYATIALDETAEFAKAIQVALDKVNIEETLIVVTADHSHVMSFTGYPERTSDILGLVGTPAEDGFDQMILSYANGLGYNLHRNKEGRVDPSLYEHYFKLPYPSTIPRRSETHGGEDVSIYAIGPWSHLFTGTLEQHTIPHFLAHASCIGPGTWTCFSNQMKNNKLK
uniref:alkaline phosphatase n=1 Tax=Culicoides sonorensis TaxID=179676 RepID=A0A336KWJ5_CULSO